MEINFISHLFFIAIRFVQVMSARSEQPPANETRYCPYAAHDHGPAQQPAAALPAQKSAATSSRQGFDIFFELHTLFPFIRDRSIY